MRRNLRREMIPVIPHSTRERQQVMEIEKKRGRGSFISMIILKTFFSLIIASLQLLLYYPLEVYGWLAGKSKCIRQ